ncbi:MAG: hypothetical protein ACOZFS_04550 [Thermodesulfobacteriota bacterium]
MQNETLLKVFKEWMTPRLAAYQEPTREGTPRGSSIGFSKAKYYAANLMILHELAKVPLAELAIKAGVSHELIRKWRTEKEFRNFAYYSFKEFKEYIEDHVLHCVDNWNADCDQWFKVMDMFKYRSLRFKEKLYHNFVDKLVNKLKEGSDQSILDWIGFFTASNFSLENLEQEKPSNTDIDITTTFILWLLSFMAETSNPLQKQLIGLLIKQLFPKDYNEWLRSQFFPD